MLESTHLLFISYFPERIGPVDAMIVFSSQNGTGREGWGSYLNVATFFANSIQIFGKHTPKNEQSQSDRFDHLGEVVEPETVMIKNEVEGEGKLKVAKNVLSSYLKATSVINTKALLTLTTNRGGRVAACS